MYTAVSLQVVPTGNNQRWSSVAADSLTVIQLMTQYRRAYIAARILPDQTIRYLDLAQFAPRYAGFVGTVQAMLTDFATTHLAAVEGGAPFLENRTAVFSDAFRAGYDALAVHPTLGTNVPMEQRADLKLTRVHPVTSYAHFATHALVSINGFYHMIETDGKSGVYVKNAAKSLAHSGQNQVGIYSFASVGSLTYVPVTDGMVKKRLTPEMIAGTVAPGPLSAIGYVKLGRDLTNKTVIPVIGGYLCPPDATYVTRVSDDEFKIDFQAIPLLHRYFESKSYLDLSDLGMSTAATNPDQISVTELYSDAVLTRYLCLSQTFFIVVDTPELYALRRFVKKTGTPGMYISYTQPKDPLVVGVGRAPEYWVTKEEEYWSLSASDRYNRQKTFDTTDPLRLLSVSASGLPMDPEYYFGASLLEIGRDIR